MTGIKYIEMDVHLATISLAVLDAAGKLIMEVTIATRPRSSNSASLRASRRSLFFSPRRCGFWRGDHTPPPWPRAAIMETRWGRH